MVHHLQERVQVPAQEFGGTALGSGDRLDQVGHELARRRLGHANVARLAFVTVSAQAVGHQGAMRAEVDTVLAIHAGAGGGRMAGRADGCSRLPVAEDIQGHRTLTFRHGGRGRQDEAVHPPTRS